MCSEYEKIRKSSGSIWKNIHTGSVGIGSCTFALDRLTHFLRKYNRSFGSDGYILKCDVRKFFNSVDHEVLKRKLQRTGLAGDVKWLLEMIIDSYEYEYLKACLSEMRRHLEDELKLEFNEKTQIHAIRQGVDYLGFHFYMTETGKVICTLRQSGKKRLKRKFHHYRLQKNIWNQFILKGKNKEDLT